MAVDQRDRNLRGDAPRAAGDQHDRVRPERDLAGVSQLGGDDL